MSAIRSATFGVDGYNPHGCIIMTMTKPGSNPDRMGLARIYLALGDNDRGFEWLTKAFDQRHGGARGAKVNPRFDRVRSDPRFQALVARLKIPD